MIGPSAYPVLPPMLKSDIPLARLRPLANTANFAPSGWKAAMPMPERNTSSEQQAVARRDRGETEADPAERDPRGQQPERPRRSDQSPNSGCMRDDETSTASISTAVSV